MKKKKIVVTIICFLFTVIALRWIYTLNSSGNTSSPNNHYNIKDFETETGIKVYNFYDLEKYIVHNEKIPLRESSNPMLLAKHNFRDTAIEYSIEVKKEESYNYTIFINTSFKEKVEDVKKDIIGDGIFYQYYHDNETDRTYTGFYVKEDFYYRIDFVNNDIEIPIMEKKLIDYIRLVEGIQ